MISDGTSPDPEGYKQMSLTAEYVISEIQLFRSMWNTNFTSEKREEALQALTYVYLNLDPNDPEAEKAEFFFNVTVDEFTKREAMLIRFDI